MFKIEFSENANNEYLEILEYIAQDNLFYANEVLNKIDYSIEIILQYPLIWKEIENWIRYIVEPKYKYKIIYKIEKEIIFIISIFKYKNLWE